MLRKMLLNAIVVFVQGSGQQSQACLCVLTLALVMLCLVKPFKKEMVDMNLLEILSLLVISTTITLGSIDSLSQGARKHRVYYTQTPTAFTTRVPHRSYYTLHLLFRSDH
jgi:hypothetical protein